MPWCALRPAKSGKRPRAGRYGIFTTSPLARFCFRPFQGGGFSLAAMFGRASVVALVGGSPSPAGFSQSSIILWDDESCARLWEIRLPGPVCAVLATASSLTAVLEDRIAVYWVSPDFSSVLFERSVESFPNTAGVCAVSRSRPPPPSRPLRQPLRSAVPRAHPHPAQTASQSVRLGGAGRCRARSSRSRGRARAACGSSRAAPSRAATRGAQLGGGAAKAAGGASRGGERWEALEGAPDETGAWVPIDVAAAEGARGGGGRVLAGAGDCSGRRWVLRSKEQAHSSRIACLAVNADGSILASASKKGTLVRLWGTEQSDGCARRPCRCPARRRARPGPADGSVRGRRLVQLRELRRGTVGADILSMSFRFSTRPPRADSGRRRRAPAWC